MAVAMAARRASACAALFISILACSGNESTPLMLPTGPSCTGITSGCWQCTQTQCPADATCIASTCGDYWPCICACSEGDETCYADCASKQDPACASCMQQVSPCETEHCGEACTTANAGSLIGGRNCETLSTPSCLNVADVLVFCYFGMSDSSCTSGYYAVGESRFPCASCLPPDLKVCKAAAVQACSGVGGDL